LDYIQEAFEKEKTQVWALNTCHRMDRWFNLATKGDKPFGMFPVWQEILALDPSERAGRLRESEVRDRLREDMKRAAPAVYKDFTAMMIDEPVLEKNRGLAGKRVADLAAQRGVDGLDAML